jgi:PAS domain S-box-containing protein
MSIARFLSTYVNGPAATTSPIHFHQDADDEIRSVYENSMDGILITTPEGRLIHANPAACTIFKMTEEELCLVGRDGIVDQSDPRLTRFLAERRLNGKAIGEIIHIRRDGERFPAEISSAVFKNSEGEERTIIIIRDITERKAFEEKLRLLNQELESRVEEKTKAFIEKEKQAQHLEQELAAQRLYHQKMMTGIAIQAQEKERNEIGKELHDNINQILGTVKLYLNMLINKTEVEADLLGLSHQFVDDAIQEIRKLSKRMVAPSLGNISLREALEELVQGLNITREFNIELNCQYNEDDRLDRDMEIMLYRVVQEQINNIRKYACSSKASIDIKQLPNQHLSLAIYDNGVGFDTSEKAQGIGLKNISSRVGYYSGSMRIISAPGKGCRLEVEIPLEKVA